MDTPSYTANDSEWRNFGLSRRSIFRGQRIVSIEQFLNRSSLKAPGLNPFTAIVIAVVSWVIVIACGFAAGVHFGR